MLSGILTMQDTYNVYTVDTFCLLHSEHGPEVVQHSALVQAV